MGVKFLAQGNNSSIPAQASNQADALPPPEEVGQTSQHYDVLLCVGYTTKYVT